jgi:DNA modification methylase
MRIEQIGNCTLHLADNLELLAGFGNEEFDLCLTDPPYGIGRDGHSQSKKSNGQNWYKTYAFKGWDNEAPNGEVFEDILRVSKDQIIWGGNYFSLPISRGWLVWYKGQQGLSMSDAELAWTSFDMPLRLVDVHRTHLWQEKPEHPTQKPLMVIQWCLAFGAKAHAVLDPYMGSGTTGVACAKRGVSFTGIEIDPEYFDIACRRIDDAYKQPDMLVEQPTPPQQPSLL